ncbi:hypothetical protein F4781DRAFT_194910 [Annulohypoxylon bovei var. microspora]|nr:hypothetical protein F4781DRAFT_194910 [Annulohypoxylon bovei var. microspora]
MSHQSDLAIELDHATDETEDVTMNDDLQEEITYGTIRCLRSAETLIDETIIIHRCGKDGKFIWVGLIQSGKDDHGRFNPPFKSKHNVLFGNITSQGSPRLANPSELVMLPRRENQMVILRAYGYLLAKKNRAYLEFRRDNFNGVIESNEPARIVSGYETSKFTSQVARAMLEPKARYLNMKYRIGRHLHKTFRLLLLARLNDAGDPEYYNPETGRVQQETTKDDIVLWESDEALDLLHKWFWRINKIMHKSSPGRYRPVKKETKRKAGHGDIGPLQKKVWIKAESKPQPENEDAEMIDATYE